MATTQDFIEYVCEQIKGVGFIRYKKMFGEYMVYVDEKPILLVCDNLVFVKILPELKDIMQNVEVGLPYLTAKQHYILDIDNAEFSKQVIKILLPIIPLPKGKIK